MSDYSEYRYLIVGGGMVADSAARGIRELDAEGTIGIVAQEETPPVARPALSKKLWTDASFSFDDAWLDTEADTGATRHAGERAVSIDREDRVVRTENGLVLRYEQLLLATGGTPNALDLPEDERVVYYRSVEDYRRLRRLAGDHRLIAVIGGSFIGTELAAALVQNDTEAILIFPEPVLGGSVFPADLAHRFEGLYREAGVEHVPAARLEQGEAGEDGLELRLTNGDRVRCDAVVVGVGVTPNIGLAERAGLETGDGVLVDDRLRTSDDRIFAAGDIASYPDAILGRRRIEHVDNAVEMGHQAGRNLAGADEPYDHTPYFYSVVFGNRYEAVGTLDSSLETVEAWSEDREQGIVFYLDGARVAGVLLWNLSGRREEARRAIAEADAGDRDALKTRIPLRDAEED
ncbi:NAD(P)/FAD-dependent oxidoreductase [Leucobacter sp. CSA1]|uniref:NAD(P)/FAD-dependent oxidoreductase n=1 Tax=Leucobacter chromiisoli TaxID=2796471 RepID=A0A934UV80_9MICO|nr:FAD-dependent oxidoreductase [Leucobacter chromiisoli]MBK0419630.1 NAD(P)/FAD-dependent oxidoreductase [Leucobacter chromiisoli]